MLRTRDFFLLLIAIVFLLVAIGATIASKFQTFDISGKQEVTFVSDTPEEFSAIVEDEVAMSRSERLALMQQKIANGLNLSIYEQPIIAESAEDNSEQAVDEGTITQVELKCSNYHAASVNWNPSQVTVVESEGARLVYKEIHSAQTGTSSVPVKTREIVLQLPLRSLPSGSASCISTDVIGITLGGTLIRNTDAGLYAPFTESTILGYALDGFPIYGTSNAPTDSCGGKVIAGQYRYQLSSERETIINCYSGTPVNI